MSTFVKRVKQALTSATIPARMACGKFVITPQPELGRAHRPQIPPRALSSQVRRQHLGQHEEGGLVVKPR